MASRRLDERAAGVYVPGAGGGGYLCADEVCGGDLQGVLVVLFGRHRGALRPHLVGWEGWEGERGVRGGRGGRGEEGW